MSIIELNITKKYDKTIFDDATLSIEEVTITSIIGQSGAEKTTLLNIIGLLDLNYEGNLNICNTSIKDLKDKDREKFRLSNISYEFQDFNLLEYLTVFENVILPLEYRNIKDFTYAKELIKKLDISELANKEVSLLSGGEKQRVAIARALVTKPKILLLDEPTGSLDEKNTNIVIDILEKINKEYNITIVMVTHSSYVWKHFESVVEIKDEKIIKKN